jgi:hypothetical protein
MPLRVCGEHAGLVEAQYGNKGEQLNGGDTDDDRLVHCELV